MITTISFFEKWNITDQCQVNKVNVTFNSTATSDRDVTSRYKKNV